MSGAIAGDLSKLADRLRGYDRELVLAAVREINALLEELGDKEREIDALSYELKEAT